MDDSRQEIIRATNSALTKHSYSELSIQNIADEFDKSKSLLYHHYEGKDEILLDYLDHTLEEFEEEVLSEGGGDLLEEFEEKAFMAFGISKDCDFLKTLAELRTHALRDERYMQKFDRFEGLYREKIVELLETGQREGEFRQGFDPERVAEFINLVNNEVIRRRAEKKDVEASREELENYLASKVYSEG